VYESESSRDVWPAEISFAEFFDNKAAETLKQIFKNYFDAQKKELDELDQEIHQFGRTVESAVEALYDHLGMISDGVDFDSAFIW
jgi:hypothetical protein